MYTHVELHSQDPAAAQAFYSGVFGWSYNEMPMPGGSYVMVSSAKGEPIGGMVKSQNDGAPDSWIGYVTVTSVKTAVVKATKLGANIVVDFTEIPGMGAFAILTDPRGGVFGIWQDAQASKPAAKKKTAKKKTTKKTTTKKTTAKKKAAKKKAAKKTAAKKTTAKKKTTKKKTTKKTTAKKTTARKKTAKKKTAKKKA